MSQIIARLRDVDIYQKDQLVLSTVNLTLSKGEFVYLIGKTGSGKSSLLKTLYAALPLSKGSGEVAGSGKRHDTCRVGVKPVGRPGALRAVDFSQYVLQSVSVEPAARMHGQGGGLVQDDDCLILVQQADAGVHRWLDMTRQQAKVTLAGSHRTRRVGHPALGIEQPPLFQEAQPLQSVRAGQQVDQGIQQRLAIAALGDRQRPLVVIGQGPRQRVDRRLQGHLPLLATLAMALGIALVAVGAGLALDVTRIILLLGRQRRLTGIALRCLGLAQSRVHPDPAPVPVTPRPAPTARYRTGARA